MGCSNCVAIFWVLKLWGWEYECLIVRGILLENNLSLAGEFCLETKLVQNGLSYFRDNAIWRGKIMIIRIFGVFSRVDDRIWLWEKNFLWNQIAMLYSLD